MKLYEAYVQGDADLVEINPLILTPDNRVHVLDAKVTLDSNSVFRHEDYAEFEKPNPAMNVRKRHTGKVSNT
ncbi:MAG: hypothetical protein Ct9H300mP26_1460 [Acidimicrobiales bacterium]|nr:MAG: hypothetical protein Ct9H300mP26_1460 [Acidimicrobiales bacterium]